MSDEYTAPDDKFAHHKFAEVPADEGTLVADKVLGALAQYWKACDDERRRLSQEHYGHGGAFIPPAAPTREGELSAIGTVLSTKLQKARAEVIDWIEGNHTENNSIPFALRKARKHFAGGAS